MCEMQTSLRFLALTCALVPLSAGRRRGLSSCGLCGRNGEARAELCRAWVYRGQVQERGLREERWWQQLSGNQSQMNRDPSLIPRRHKTPWQHISCSTHTVITHHHLLDFSLHTTIPDVSSHQIYHTQRTAYCLFCQYLMLPNLLWNAPSQAKNWKNSDFWDKFKINFYYTI